MSYVSQGLEYDNKPNVDFTDREEDMDQLQEEFETMLKFDEVDDSADPYLVYKLNNEIVGWYDAETLVGYIK
jgi:hypothetical protein